MVCCSIETDSVVHVRDTRYTKLECIGQGGSSKVFKIRVSSTSEVERTWLCLNT
jgi:hypothetical protein